MNIQEQNKISKVIDDCVVCWVMHEIPRPKINEMELELKQHLENAVVDGKTIQSVISDNVNDFAVNWAEEITPVKKTWRDKALEWWYCMLLSAAVTLPWQHLRYQEFVFTVYWDTPVQILIIVVVVKLFFSKPAWSSKILNFSSFKFFIYAYMVFIVITLVFMLILYLIDISTGKTAFFEWPWTATLALMVFTSVFCRWYSKKDVTAPVDMQNDDNRDDRKLKYIFYTAAAGLLVALAISIYIWLSTGNTIMKIIAELCITAFGISLWTLILTWPDFKKTS